MKKWMLYMLLAGSLLVGALLAACDNKDINNPIPRTGDKEVQQDAQGKAAGALEKARQERDEFVAKAQEELQELDEEMETLNQRLKNLSGVAKDKLQHELQELEAERKEAEQKLAALKTQAVEKWQALKDGVSSAISRLKERMQKAKSDTVNQ